MHSSSLKHIIGINVHTENGHTRDLDVVMTYFLRLEPLPASSFAPRHPRSTRRQFPPPSHSTASHRPDLCLSLWLFPHHSRYTSLAGCPVISFHACCKCFCPTDSEESRLRNEKGWVWKMHQVRLRHCMLNGRLDTSSCGELDRVYLLYLSFIQSSTLCKDLPYFRTHCYDHAIEYILITACYKVCKVLFYWNTLATIV